MPINNKAILEGNKKISGQDYREPSVFLSPPSSLLTLFVVHIIQKFG